MYSIKNPYYWPLKTSYFSVFQTKFLIICHLLHKYYIDRAIGGNFVFIRTGNMELRIEVGKLVIKSSGIYTAVVFLWRDSP